MALFSRTTLDGLRPLLMRVARVEATRLPAVGFRDKGPFSEERLRLLGPWAQDTGLSPEALGTRLAKAPDQTFDEALAWRAGIDADAESAAFETEVKNIGRAHRKLAAELLGYIGKGERFGASGPVDRMKPAFAELGGYIAYSPSRRGLLVGRITSQQTLAGLEINTLTDDVFTGRYNYSFRGVADKLWEDLTYVRPAALAFDRALTREVLTGNTAAESIYLRRAQAMFRETYGEDIDACLDDLDWWIVRELRARRDQRMQMRRTDTCEIIDNLSLAPAGAQYDVYWVFDEVLGPLEVLLEAKQSTARRMAAFAIDRMIRFEPPTTAAAFHYDTNLLLAEAALSEDPPVRIANRLRGLTDFEDYHQLLRDAWTTIQHLIAGGRIRVGEDAVEGQMPDEDVAPGLAGGAGEED